jgi:hypothetical protein
MSGAILTLLKTPSWRGAQLKEEALGKFYLYLIRFICTLL